MKYFTAVILCLTLLSCGPAKDKKETAIVRGFYYWRSNFDLDKDQLKFLNRVNAKVLYVKYFDVVYDGIDYYPDAVLQGLDDKIQVEIVPTVFITPEVFSKISEAEIPTMADNIAAKIKSIHKGRSLNEIQFDCDWTPSIKEKYFAFLEEIRPFFPKCNLSATVRLYQYKYPNISGVPPVDKGLLMYYNMGNLSDYEEHNSILNNELGKQYIGFNDYPLPLDIALPNFQWSLLFRQGEFQQICPDFTLSQLNDNGLFLETKNNLYTFRKDTVMYNTYFRFGDEIRYEYCSETDLITAVKLLKNEINQSDTRILIYDLQPNTHQEYEKINTVFSAFDQ